MEQHERDIILPEPTLKRLPWYLAYVDTLAQRGVDNISSTAMSKALNVDASQIAKDLSFLNLRGKTRIGYSVEAMRSVLTGFLGFRDPHVAYMFGAGSLGAALIQDTGLAHYGLNIIAAFDVDPTKTGTRIGGVNVSHISRLSEIMTQAPATIGIIAVPAESAQDVADLAIGAGIKALWNFTPFRLTVPDDVVMTSTSIYANLALIYNRLRGAGNYSKEK